MDPDEPRVYVQTDAPINPGSSGGALIDGQGNLVGLNVFNISDDDGTEGLGFAIPEPVVRFAYRKFRDRGRLRHPTIRAHAQTITPDFAAGLKLPRDYGVFISDVMIGGPADKAGIKPQDVISKVDDSANGTPAGCWGWDDRHIEAGVHAHLGKQERDLDAGGTVFIPANTWVDIKNAGTERVSVGPV